MDLHPDPRVHAALAALEVEEPQLARRAEGALNGLIWGEGLETISQLDLQRMLWYQLPCKWLVDLDEHLAVADALGRLLRLLELPRYAELCHSQETEAILRAYDRSHREGLRAFSAAEQRSGVVPPDLPAGRDGPAFAWGTLMGVDEASAHAGTAATLELAITVGEFRPGARGWRRAQRAVAGSCLWRPRSELGGASWLDAVLAERRQHWQRSRSPLRGNLLAAILPRLDRAEPAPTGTADAVAPLRWLLSIAAHGASLTETGSLRRAQVVDAAHRFGWYDERFPPRREADLNPLYEVDRLARRLGAVRPHGRTLRLTPAGQALLDDPARLLTEAVTTLVTGRGFEEAVAELAFALLLDRGRLPEDEMRDWLGQVLAAEGWREHDSGAAPDEVALRTALWTCLRPATALRLVEPHDVSANTEVALTPVGRWAATAALRARANAPKTDPMDL